MYLLVSVSGESPVGILLSGQRMHQGLPERSIGNPLHAIVSFIRSNSIKGNLHFLVYIYFLGGTTIKSSVILSFDTPNQAGRFLFSVTEICFLPI